MAFLGSLAASPRARLICPFLLFLLFLLLQKLWELAKQVSEFLVWRQVMCPFDRDRRVLQYLVTTPVFSEDGAYGFRTNTTPLTLKSSHVLIGLVLSRLFAGAELHLASYESEGPENNLEKDSRRSLRWVVESTA